MGVYYHESAAKSNPIMERRNNMVKQLFGDAFTTPSASTNKASATNTPKSTKTGNSATPKSTVNSVTPKSTANSGQVSVAAAYTNTPNVTAQYDAFQNALAQQRQNAQNAYNKNNAAINSMYSNRLSGLNSRYNEGRSALEASHAAQQEAIRKAKEEAQRQAYISSMVAERDLEQNLSAQGLSGGASETTLAKMRNNYANNRNSNEEEYLNTSADIGIAYQNELANLENQYLQLRDALETAKAQATMQNENALANSEAATISQFADHANSLDYLSAQNALNLAAQERMAALNQQYALEQMEREQANKLNYAQYSSGLSERADNLKTLKAYLKEQGYSDEKIAAIISSYS